MNNNSYDDKAKTVAEVAVVAIKGYRRTGGGIVTARAGAAVESLHFTSAAIASATPVIPANGRFGPAPPSD
jgi:hypothetical protein